MVDRESSGKSSDSTRSDPSPVWNSPAAWIYLAELCALAAALMLYRRGDRPLTMFLGARSGQIFAAGLVGFTASVLFTARLVRTLPPPRARRVVFLLVLNLGSMLLAFGIAEALVRSLATETVRGTVVADTVLLPRDWAAIAARSRAALDVAAAGRSYLVPDTGLGWTIGPNRQSTDYNRQLVERFLIRLGHPPPPATADREGNIYSSSAEGLRSPRAGMSFLAGPVKRRIAVVGDSFTFGLEVRYEDTWAHQLERALGPKVQVLNFGVDGYGVDQAYLRYQRDVLAWHPELVIMGVIDDDLRRTMCVYAFLCFRSFGVPFSKPRLVLTEHGPVPVNLPLPAPQEAFAKRAIRELPFLELDESFEPVEWERRFYHHSYVMRLALSRFRPWQMTRRAPVTADAMKMLNGEIFRSFVRLVRERNSIPILAVFPAQWNVSADGPGDTSVAKAALDAAHLHYLDLTACVDRVPVEERFVALHYSPRTNAAVAKCLRDAITGGFESTFEGEVRKTAAISSW